MNDTASAPDPIEPTSGRFFRDHVRYPTEIGLLRGLTGGLILAVLFYVALLWSPVGHTYFGDIFLRRGWVTVVEVGLAAWALWSVVLKLGLLREQESLARHGGLPPATTTRITSERDITDLLTALEQSASLHHRSLLFQRVRHAMQHFRSHPQRRAVSELLGSLAYLDAQRSESTYSMLRVIIWAIPIVGFIGTVVGLGGAVGGFSASLPQATDFAQLRETLSGVTSGLSVAFDATFVALLLSLVLMFPVSLLEKRENHLLSQIDEYCQRDLLARLPDVDSTSVRSPAAAWEEEQRRILAWWTQLHEDFAHSTRETVNATAAVSRDIRGSADALRSALWNAVDASTQIASALQSAAAQARDVAQSTSVAREQFDQLELAAAHANAHLAASVDAISRLQAPATRPPTRPQ